MRRFRIAAKPMVNRKRGASIKGLVFMVFLERDPKGFL
jgi:hypothetical protein